MLNLLRNLDSSDNLSLCPGHGLRKHNCEKKQHIVNRNLSVLPSVDIRLFAKKKLFYTRNTFEIIFIRMFCLLDVTKR